MTTDIEIFRKLASEIDWTEPWLICVMSVHLLCTIIAIVTHLEKAHNFQLGLFAILICFGAATERINEYGAENWRLFAGQQYFDSSGLFMTLVFSLPIVLNCLLILREKARASVSAKRKEKEIEIFLLR
ncbi:transmembrane protein 18-like isoform X2 [Oscarella lobularis]|uniref:transmembrane protein 18-like isoform X2 n=1 Tax=Oscarella lobularis TaxID=121494 RepID=UPI0033133BE0